MGLFDNIVKKATEIVSDTIESNILEGVKNKINDNLNGKIYPVSNSKYQSFADPNNKVISYLGRSEDFRTEDISERYNIFPKYNGTALRRLYEKETTNYWRISILYSGIQNDEFISTLIQNGFVKATSIRYDKDNYYVIVNSSKYNTEIVYHIKK